MSDLHPLLTSNLNFFWGGVLAETLKHCGLTHAVISPGSRSAPLATALALTPGIEAVSILDERSAAFYALGLAKASGRPVAVVCTSGTAAANFLPAVIEARLSETPLLLLTADRPPELRDCSSGQTIDQHKIFGNYALFYHETALPHADRLDYLRNLIQQAWRRASGPIGGPVHCNLPFRDPLAPLPDGDSHTLPENFFSTQSANPGPSPRACPDLHQLLQYEKGLIITGPASPRDPNTWLKGVSELARYLGWPVLTDALSPVRHHELKGIQRIAHYDIILRKQTAAESLRPDAVLQIGPLPTSKVLRQWLHACPCPTWIMEAGSQNRDSLHRNHVLLPIDPGSLGELGTCRETPQPYAGEWALHEERVRESLGQAMARIDTLFEGKLASVLPHWLPAATPLFIASSMPVRDAEFFWPCHEKGHQMFANREANGIDGTLSSALGVMHVQSKPGILITGDLALLHDQNGLLQAPNYPGSLTILVINNQGGGIFENLPIAAYNPPFETYFATPQELDFAMLARAHHLEYHAPTTWDSLKPLMQTLPAQGVRLIEIKTDRKADTALRRQILATSA